MRSFPTVEFLIEFDEFSIDPEESVEHEDQDRPTSSELNDDEEILLSVLKKINFQIIFV